MSKSNTTENDFVKMVFLGTDPSWRTGGATSTATGQARVYTTQLRILDAVL